MLLVCGVFDLDLKLSHGTNEGFCAVDQVLEYRMAVERELVVCVAILVYNLHLLDNSAFAALSRAYKRVLVVLDVDLGFAHVPAARVCSHIPYLAAISCIHGAASSNPPRVPGRSSGCASSGRPHRSLRLTCTHPS